MWAARPVGERGARHGRNETHPYGALFLLRRKIIPTPACRCVLEMKVRPKNQEIKTPVLVYRGQVQQCTPTAAFCERVAFSSGETRCVRGLLCAVCCLSVCLSIDI